VPTNAHASACSAPCLSRTSLALCGLRVSLIATGRPGSVAVFLLVRVSRSPRPRFGSSMVTRSQSEVCGSESDMSASTLPKRRTRRAQPKSNSGTEQKADCSSSCVRARTTCASSRVRVRLARKNRTLATTAGAAVCSPSLRGTVVATLISEGLAVPFGAAPRITRGPGRAPWPSRNLVASARQAAAAPEPTTNDWPRPSAG
jgi:hypothetical protein